MTTTADSGTGSLRQAILDANAMAGADAIRFDIPGGAGAVRTIRPASPLPTLSGPVALDGTTQVGYGGSPLVELDGSAAGSAAHGLTITGTDVVVRGLAVNRFARNGIVVAGDRARVEASYVGTDATGDAAAGNGGAGVYISGAAAVVGGTAAARRNVISGNRLAGVWIVGQAAAVLGNSIGTDVTGAWPLGNGGSGVLVDGARDVVVGGAEAGAGNLISGNGASGVRVGPGASATVQGNRIGTDAFGARDVPNGTSVTTSYRDGVTADHVGSLLVGGTDAAARNVISGNAGAGVGVLGRGAVEVRGNYIGTDATGSVAVGNAGDGVSFGDLATVSGAGVTLYAVQNVISGNGRNGVRIFGAQVGGPVVRVYGNLIGTNAAGAAPLGNAGAGVLVQGAAAEVGSAASGRNVISANGGHGVHVVGDLGLVSNNYVGTDVSGRVALGNGGHGVFFENARGRVGTGMTHPYSGGPGNVIAGNRGNGVMVFGTAGGSSVRPGVDVRSNRIGTDAAGDAVLPGLGNGGHGVAVVNATAVRVGGDSSGGAPGGNTIAFNGGSGVYVEGADPGGSGSARTAALVLGNSIFSNARLGIDLAAADPATGVTLNDAGDEDRGPNTLLNYPVITSVVTRPGEGGAPGETVVRATVAAGTRVEFFASPAPDPSGFGEGRTYLGAVTAPADLPPGGGVIGARLPAVPAGTSITATASINGVTSEFSPAVAEDPVPPPPPVLAGRFVSSPLVAPGVNTPGKRALRPGEAPTFEHITNTAGGVAGVALEGLTILVPAAVTRDDFVFRLSSNSGGPGPLAWTRMLTPTPIVQAAGAPGRDRVVFDVRSLPVRGRWLEVTVLANEQLGLARPEVFYFGNLLGETGDAGSPLRVTALDVAALKGALGTTDPALRARYDFNGDGRVDALDLAAQKQMLTRRLLPPGVTPAGPAAAAREGHPVRAFFLFWAAQAGMWTPVVFALGAAATVACWRGYQGLPLADRVLTWGATLPLVVFAFAATRAHGEENWTDLAYFPMSVLLVKFVSRAWERRGPAAWVGCSVALGIAAVVQFPEAIRAAHLHVPVSLRNLFGWRELGMEIGRAADATGADLVLADRMQDAGELGFYMPGRPQVWFHRPPGRRPSAFDFFDDPPEIARARRILFVGDHAAAFCKANGFEIASAGLWVYHHGGRTPDRKRSYWLLVRKAETVAGEGAGTPGASRRPGTLRPVPPCSGGSNAHARGRELVAPVGGLVSLGLERDLSRPARVVLE